ncbi:hypothetical protein [Pseudoalteromonas sp. MMG005]|uniref:hypothetical protein n=1 Tax=Pseudoalteromonas sp. MMG005 TaxID=2822682 RepID=UPI001B3A6469|nr:hypothetical protein [Pseudoalteromonas sp. MMG005]MBQ4847463.1 hypothetical protein [Pseudoalteromonas sp. MMG005]
MLRMGLFLAAITLSGCVSFTDADRLLAKDWRYATDSHGSRAIFEGGLVKDGQIDMGFSRVPRLDKANNSWVELIYDIPQRSLEGYESVTVTYQSDRALIIKLSQKDYGGQGDKSYAHYQVTLPKADKKTTHTVMLSDFSRPDWTPKWSTGKGMIKAHINALYFVPSLTDKDGGKAQLSISALTLNKNERA